MNVNSRPPYTIHVCGSMRKIAARQWDACAGGMCPFVRHAFLAALEDSGSVGASSGWIPCHMVLRDENDEAVACAPLYVKTHSLGEFVFDQGWADAYMRAGGAYYPKLLCAVPFTPVTGPRLLVRDGAPEEARLRLAEALVAFARQKRFSSLHVNFLQPHDAQALEGRGCLLREDCQYHWNNRGYGDFSDFLATLTSRKRRMVIKERARAVQGLSVVMRTGEDASSEEIALLGRFYEDTIKRKWSRAYLKPSFFLKAARALGRDFLLWLAYERGSGAAAGVALHIRGREALYGRYWGGGAGYRGLHFELCYYRAMVYAIEHGLKRVEAGAQGGHKLMRGYEPCVTRSAHWFLHEAMRVAVGDFLKAERRHVSEVVARLGDFTPFAQRDSAEGG